MAVSLRNVDKAENIRKRILRRRSIFSVISVRFTVVLVRNRHRLPFDPYLHQFQRSV